MDVLKSLVGVFIFFIFLLFKFSPKTIVYISLVLLNISLFMGAVFTSNAVLQVATVFDIFSIAGMCSIIFFKRDNGAIRINKTSFFIYIVFILFQLIHNFIQFGISTDFSGDTIKLINPYGLAASFMFLFALNSKTELNFVDTRQFRLIILFSAGIFCMLMLMVKVGVIEGNTSKVSENAGGIGLKNLSTNEAALYAICNIVYFLHFFRTLKRNKIIYLLAIPLCLVDIFLSQSRVGIIALSAVIMIAIFININRRQLITYIVGSIFLLIVLSPLLKAFYEIFQKRSNTDLVGRIKYSTLAIKLGTTMSGRLLIWEAFIDEFFKLNYVNSYVLYIGAGFGNLSKMFLNSFLPLVGAPFKGANFYPLHSDVLLTFITGGIAGIGLWLASVANAVKCAFRKYSFISVSFCFVLILFSLIDMLSYSLYSSLLIGMGIAYSLYTPGRTNTIQVMLAGLDKKISAQS